MTNPRKMLVKVLTGQDQGGVRTSELSYIEKCRQRGISVAGLIVEHGPTAKEYQKLLTVSKTLDYYIPDFGGGGRIKRPVRVVANHWHSWNAARLFFDEFRKEIADFGVPAAISVRRAHLIKLTGLLSRKLGAAAYWHMPNAVTSNFGRRFYRRVLKRHDIYPIGNSKFTLNSLGYHEGSVVYPGYSPDRIFATPQRNFRSELGIEAGAQVFGMATRIAAAKIPDVVVNAFISSKAFKNGAHLVIAGGPLESRLGRSLKSLALERGNGRVHLLGRVSEVADFYDLIAVYINGRKDPEPFGISIVEALAAGVPVIAYRPGGPEETIIDGKTGWFVETPDSHGYSGQIDRAWEFRENWPAMSEECTRTAQKFSAENQLSRYLEVVGLE